MKKRKKHALKSKKIIWLAILVVVLLIILFEIGIKVSFVAKNELSIGINPLQQVVETDQMPVTLNFTIKNHNSLLCKTQCELSLYDPYTNKSISKESIVLDSNSELEKTYKINLETRGQGQRVLYFEVQCYDIRTALCQTDEKSAFKSSFVAINYSLSEQEAQVRDLLKQALNEQSERVNYALNLVSQNKQIASDIQKIMNLQFDIEKQNTAVNISLNRLYIYQDYWKQDKYLELEELWYSDDIDSTIAELEKTKDKNLQNVQSYNTIVNTLNRIKLDWQKYNKAYNFYLKTDNQKANNFEELYQRIKARLIVLNTTIFNDFNKQEQPLSNLETQFDEMLSIYDIGLAFLSFLMLYQLFLVKFSNSYLIYLL